jgi:hypothetical protein
VRFDAANLDGPATRTIKVQVTDDKGLTATDEASVNVSNVAPTVQSIVTSPTSTLTANASKARVASDVFTTNTTHPHHAAVRQ